MSYTKYIFTGETMEHEGHTLRRIQGINLLNKGLGGWIESEDNLSHLGNCWVADGALVYGAATVRDNARVSSYARVYDRAEISGNAIVNGYAHVCGLARVTGGQVTSNAVVRGSAEVHQNPFIGGYAAVGGNVVVGSDAIVTGHAELINPTDILLIGPIGSRYDTTTFYRARINDEIVVYVACGCFRGTLSEFIKRVKQVYPDHKHGREYQAAAELAKLTILGDDDDDKNT